MNEALATVALVAAAEDAHYPPPPYSPLTAQPEYPHSWLPLRPESGAAGTDVYSMVRESLHLLRLDRSQYGKEKWNPLGEFIAPGNTVLVKPNLVHHENRSGGGTDCLVTQAAVLRPIIDYVSIALKGSGQVVVGDAPVQACDFDELLRVSGIDALADVFDRTMPRVDVCDFRETVSHWNRFGLLAQEGRLAGGGGDAVRIDLGAESALCPLDRGADRYRVTFYDSNVMAEHHHIGRHVYSIARRVLASDVVVSVAKMKTHTKAGVTGALKNSVGINTAKEFLPHHRSGSPTQGGDEYPTASWLKRLASKLHDHEYSSRALPLRALHHMAGIGLKALVKLQGGDWTWAGSWAGNDTLWRMVVDLNRILVYADKDGIMRSEPQRRIFCLVDGLIAGEAEGPLEPTPRPVGVILAGASPAHVDAVMATVMGFDWRKIPAIRESLRREKAGCPADGSGGVEVVSNRSALCGPLSAAHRLFDFVPASGWVGSVELGAG